MTVGHVDPAWKVSAPYEPVTQSASERAIAAFGASLRSGCPVPPPSMRESRRHRADDWLSLVVSGRRSGESCTGMPR
jgi:hypothetical protein